MIKILLVEDDLGLSNSVFDFWMILQMSCRSLMEKKVSTKLKVAFMTWFCLTWCCRKKMGSSLERIAWKGNHDTSPYHDCQREFGWQGTRFWAWSGWLPHQTFLPWRTQNANQALLKRSGKFNENTLTYGDIVVNLSTNEVKVEDTPGTTRKRVWLLVYFLQNQNVILPKTQIFDRLWGFDSDTTISVVEVYVSKVRKKLKGTAFAENLQTLRSVGYILKDVQ